MGAAPIHGDRRTDTTKKIDTFRDYANAPNNGVTVVESTLTTIIIIIIIMFGTEIKANSCCLL